MPAFISPLDVNYISLKRAALLIAREQAGIEPDEIMDMFKYALFSREFERQEIAVLGQKPADDWNLPLMRIEVPASDMTVRHLPLDSRPQEYFAFTGSSIADVLSERGALPGSPESWSGFTTFPRDAGIVTDTLTDLARIPYTAFPARAHDILGDIMLSKIKLRTWMVFKGYDLPSFLKRSISPVQKAAPIEPTGKDARDLSRGRPGKAAWGRVGELVRELHAAHPKKKRSALAFEALKIAATEFDKKDLPSVETVVRRMKEILGEDTPPGHSLH
jgi:hypothetical protein